MLNLQKILLSVIVGITLVLQYGLGLLLSMMIWQYFDPKTANNQNPNPLVMMALVLVLIIFLEIVKKKIKKIIQQS